MVVETVLTVLTVLRANHNPGAERREEARPGDAGGGSSDTIRAPSSFSFFSSSCLSSPASPEITLYNFTAFKQLATVVKE